MNLSVRLKVLVLLIVVTLLAVSVTLVSTRIGFQRGLTDYVKDQQLDSLRSVAALFSEFYSHAGSWDILRENPQAMRLVLDGQLFTAGLPGDQLEVTTVNRGPPRWPRPGDPRLDGSSISSRIRPEELRLLDAQGNIVIVGEAALDEGAILEVPVTLNGEHVGSVITQDEGISQGLDLQFERAQSRLSIIIGTSVLLATIPAAMLFTAWILAPVGQLTTAVRKMAKGDLSLRLDTARGDELGQLAEDINLLAHALEQYRNDQRRWIADMSHELRTPVAILAGEVEALRDGIRQPGAKELNSLASEVGRIQHLIDDLYTLSQGDAGELNYTMSKLDIGQLINQVILNYQSRFEKNHLSVETSGLIDDVTIYGDRERLIQLFSNLSENSCRYTDSGGSVQIAIKRTHNCTLVEWQDSSPNVPDASLERIFDRLYRVEVSRSRQFGGAGLGLSICKNIAQAHKASISAHQSELGGVLFRIIFPNKENHV